MIAGPEVGWDGASSHHRRPRPVPAEFRYGLLVRYSVSDVDDSELWSPAARETYALTAERVRSAVDSHVAAVEEAHSVDVLESTATELEAALAAMSESEQALTGAAAYWLDLADPDGPDDSDADLPGNGRSGQDAPPDGVVAVTADLQMTMDVTDTSRLLAQARELEPETPIISIEDAIFVITGQLGWDHLLADQVEGVTMQGATAQLVTS